VNLLGVDGAGSDRPIVALRIGASHRGDPPDFSMLSAL
jgi:hypothetical protein